MRGYRGSLTWATIGIGLAVAALILIGVGLLVEAAFG